MVQATKTKFAITPARATNSKASATVKNTRAAPTAKNAKAAEPSPVIEETKVEIEPPKPKTAVELALERCNLVNVK